MTDSDFDSDIEYHDTNSFDSDEFNNLMRHGPGYDDENEEPNDFGTTDFEPGYLGIGYDAAEDNDGYGFFLDDYVDGKLVIEGELCEKCEETDCQCGYKFNAGVIVSDVPVHENITVGIGVDNEEPVGASDGVSGELFDYDSASDKSQDGNDLFIV